MRAAPRVAVGDSWVDPRDVAGITRGVGPKALTLREGANKTTQKVGAVSSGDDVMVLELSRTRTGTLRARTQCGRPFSSGSLSESSYRPQMDEL